MRWCELSEQHLAEIEKWHVGGELADGWEERVGDFESDKLGIKDPPDPNQHDLFPDAPTHVKPGASPYGHNSPYVRIGSIGEYSVGRPRAEGDDEDASGAVFPDEMPDRVLVVVFDAVTPVGYVLGDFMKANMGEDQALKIEGVRIDRKYGGRGLGVELYRWLLQNMTDWIEADDTQTQGGAGLWKKFVLSPEFQVFHEWKGVDPDDDEMEDAEWKEITDLDMLERAYQYDASYLWVRLAE